MWVFFCKNLRLRFDCSAQTKPLCQVVSTAKEFKIRCIHEIDIGINRINSNFYLKNILVFFSSYFFNLPSFFLRAMLAHFIVFFELKIGIGAIFKVVTKEMSFLFSI
jgi:hypothetical protein